MSDLYIRLNKDEARAVREMIEARRKDAARLLDPFDPLTTALDKVVAFTTNRRHTGTDAE